MIDKKNIAHLILWLSLGAHAGSTSDLSSSDSENNRVQQRKVVDSARTKRQKTGFQKKELKEEQTKSIETLKLKMLNDLLPNIPLEPIEALRMLSDLVKSVPLEKMTALIKETRKKPKVQTKNKTVVEEIRESFMDMAKPVNDSIRKALMEGSKPVHILLASRIKDIDASTLRKQFMQSVQNGEPTIISFEREYSWRESDHKPLEEQCDDMNLPVLLNHNDFSYKHPNNVALIDFSQCLDLKSVEWIPKAVEYGVPIQFTCSEPRYYNFCKKHPGCMEKIFETNLVFSAALPVLKLREAESFQALRKLTLYVSCPEKMVREEFYDKMNRIFSMPRFTPNLISLTLDFNGEKEIIKEFIRNIARLNLPRAFARLNLPKLRDFTAIGQFDKEDAKVLCRILPRNLQSFSLTTTVNLWEKTRGADAPLVAYIARSFDSLTRFSASISFRNTLVEWLDGLKQHENLSLLRLNFCKLKSSEILQRMQTTDEQKKEERKKLPVLFPAFKTLQLDFSNIAGALLTKGLADMIISAFPLLDFHKKDVFTQENRPLKYIDIDVFYLNNINSAFILFALKMLKYSGTHVHLMLSKGVAEYIKDTNLLSIEDETRLHIKYHEQTFWP